MGYDYNNYEMVQNPGNYPYTIFIHTKQGLERDGHLDENGKMIVPHLMNHWHEAMEIDYIFNGSWQFIVNGQERIVSKDEFIVINCGDIHGINFDFDLEGMDTIGFTILIGEDFLKAVIPDLHESIFDDRAVRAELAGARTLGSNLGSLVATSCTMMVVNAYGGGQKGYTLMAVTFGIAIIVLLLITGINCKEYKVEEAAAGGAAEQPKEAATPMGQAVKILLTSKYTWIVTGCFVFNWLGICTNSTAMVYYARDVLGNSGYITYLAFAISLPAIIITAIGIVPKLTGMYGKKKMMMLGAGLQVIGFVIAFLVPESLAGVLVGLVVRTFGLGIFVANLFASVADVADYVDITNKVHIAGVTNSVTSFGMKVGVGLGSATVGWVLAIVGYSAELANAGEMQSTLTIFGERLCYSGIPALFCLIVFFLSCFIDVDTKLAQLRTANA